MRIRSEIKLFGIFLLSITQGQEYGRGEYSREYGPESGRRQSYRRQGGGDSDTNRQSFGSDTFAPSFGLSGGHDGSGKSSRQMFGSTDFASSVGLSGDQIMGGDSGSSSQLIIGSDVFAPSADFSSDQVRSEAPLQFRTGDVANTARLQDRFPINRPSGYRKNNGDTAYNSAATGSQWGLSSRSEMNTRGDATFHGGLDRTFDRNIAKDNNNGASGSSYNHGVKISYNSGKSIEDSHNFRRPSGNSYSEGADSGTPSISNNRAFDSSRQLDMSRSLTSRNDGPSINGRPNLPHQRFNRLLNSDLNKPAFKNRNSGSHISSGADMPRQQLNRLLNSDFDRPALNGKMSGSQNNKREPASHNSGFDLSALGAPTRITYNNGDVTSDALYKNGDGHNNYDVSDGGSSDSHYTGTTSCPDGSAAGSPCMSDRECMTSHYCHHSDGQFHETSGVCCNRRVRQSRHQRFRG